MLDNKVIVITGAGRGLGRALAAAFAAEKTMVVGIGRDIASLEGTQEAISRDNFQFELTDVGDHEEVSACMDRIVDRHGTVDIVFNNAAIYPKVNFLEETHRQWCDAINTNVNGVANVCKSVLPVMISNGYGRVYNVGSWADVAPIQNSAAYSTSKGALHALTKSIYEDLKPLCLDIEVHEWIPGHLNTRMSDFTGIDPKVSAKWAVQLVLKYPKLGRSVVFENDQLRESPKRLKDRVLDRILFRPV